MLSGRSHVLAIGFPDAAATQLIPQGAGRVTAVNVDQTQAESGRRESNAAGSIEYLGHDFADGPAPGSFDAACVVNAIAAIAQERQPGFLRNIVSSLTPDGMLVLGSEDSSPQHWDALKILLDRFFRNVLLFSLSAETLDIGLRPGADYVIAVACTRSAPKTEAAADEDSPDISFVVPCLNEENHIAATLETLTAAMSELPHRYEVMVVDDGSTDGTARIVENFIAANPSLPIRLIRHAQNRGLTRSYVDAAFRGRGKYYRLVCGDNAESKEGLIAAFSHLGKADMIIPYYESVAGKSAFRMWISNLYTNLVNSLSGYKIRYYNGLAVHLRYNVMRWGPYSFGFGFQAELITRLLDEGCSYVEVAVTTTHREKSRGNSALNFKNFLSVSHTLSEVFIRRIRKRALRK